MPVYKDEKRGTFFCSFYYTTGKASRRRKPKEALSSNAKRRLTSVHFWKRVRVRLK